jgi:hypothetical protein
MEINVHLPFVLPFGYDNNMYVEMINRAHLHVLDNSVTNYVMITKQ